MSDVAPERLRADRSTLATLRSSPRSCQHAIEDGEAGYREQHVPPCSVRDRSPDEVAKGRCTVDGDQHGESKPTCMPTGAWSVPGVVARHGDKVLGSSRSRTGAAPPLGAPALVPRSRRRVRNHLAILGATHPERSQTRRTDVDDKPCSNDRSRTVVDRPGSRSGRYGIRTHGDPEATTAFEAAPFVRSGNLPEMTLPEVRITSERRSRPPSVAARPGQTTTGRAVAGGSSTGA